jgi:hypothetical protein
MRRESRIGVNRSLQFASGALCVFMWLWILDAFQMPPDAWWNAWWTPLAAFGAGALAAVLTRPITRWLAAVNLLSFVLWCLWMRFGFWGL